MDFLGIEAFEKQRAKQGRDTASGLTYNELSYMATDGTSSGGPFDDRTKAFLSRCSYAAYELRANGVEAELMEAAESCVPYGNYDRWVIFTDLVGWENDAYFEALNGMADLDDASSIPAYVNTNMAFTLIAALIKREDDFI